MNNSKVLILYATREGQTEKVAKRITEVLVDCSVTVTLINAKEPRVEEIVDLNAFDLLVFGASMHAGGLEKELIDYVNRNGKTIESKKRSFFLVLLSAATRDPELRADWLADARKKMCEQLSVTFDDTEVIAGALTYSKYPPPLKWVMKRIAKRAGGDTDVSKDYEYTDWQQVECYAKRLSGG